MGSLYQRVKFLDVGHGDSSVIYLYDRQSEAESVIVIDVANCDKLLQELKSHEVKIIDLLVISHSDADHCRGVNNFLEKFIETGVVKQVCYNLDKNPLTKTSRFYFKKLLELYRGQGVDVLSGQNDTPNQKKELFSNDNSSLFLLYPNAAEFTEAYVQNNTNNASIVCLLENKACKILFSGDLEEYGWKSLLERMPDLQCNVIKMPHHGAFYDGKKEMGLKAILETLNPQNAIISSGNNQKYNHPDKKTIELLNEKMIKIYCTEFTTLCHCNLNEFNKKCYGNIDILVDDFTYVIKTESENLLLLCNGACC